MIGEQQAGNVNMYAKNNQENSTIITHFFFDKKSKGADNK